MTADDALREEIARALAEHSGWSQSGPDDGVHLNCFDCGDDLGLERVIVSDWIHRTGKDPAEWNTHGAVPAYDERLAEHQADAILPIVARVEQEAYRRGQVDALREVVSDMRSAWEGSWNLRDPHDPEVAYSVDRWIEVRADRIEKGSDDGR